MKIIFIGYGILGDFIVCLKSIERLRENFPDAHITYVGNKTFAQLGLDGYHINEVLERTDEFNQYYQKSGYQSDFWDKVFEKSNLVVNHLMDLEGIFVKNMQERGFVHQTEFVSIDKINKVKILLHGDVKDENATAYEQVGELLKNIRIFHCDTPPNLIIPEAIQEEVNKEFDKIPQGSKIWAFHPGASSREKCMGLPRWVDVINAIIERDDFIIILPGPEEVDMIEQIKHLFKNNNFIIIHNKGLLFEAGVVRNCHYFLGHDTGFAHIAGALKVPSFLVFGPHSSARVWKPPYHNTKSFSLPDIALANENEIIYATLDWLNSVKEKKLAEELLVCFLKDEEKAIRLIHENPGHNYTFCYFLSWVNNVEDIDVEYIYEEPEVYLNRKKYKTAPNVNSYPDGRFKVDLLFLAVYVGSEKLVSLLLEKKLPYIFYIRGFKRCGEHHFFYISEYNNIKDSILAKLKHYFKK